MEFDYDEVPEELLRIANQNSICKSSNLYDLGLILGGFQCTLVTCELAEVETSQRLRETLVELHRTLHQISIINYLEISENIEIVKDEISRFLETRSENSNFTKKDIQYLQNLFSLLNNQLIPKRRDTIFKMYKTIAKPSVIHSKIKIDLFESLNDFLNSCYRSSVVMSRLTVQRVLEINGIESMKNENEYKTINRMLKEAVGKKLISKVEYIKATKIRELGGLGAHPQRTDELDKITQKDAASILEETFSLIGSIYNEDKLMNLRIPY